MVRKLGCQELVHLKTSPQAYKKWPQLPNRVEARLLTRTINGKDQQVLTSMVDPMHFPSADIVKIYSHRWEIELGYREMKNSLQQHRLTLPNKKAASLKGDMARQFVLLERRARSYSRCVKPRPQRYSMEKVNKNASQV